MPSVNTNLSSLIVQTNLKSSTKRLNIAIERMSTGFKINHAKDNAANYSIKTKLSSKISSYEVAEENAMMGLDMLETSSEALNHIEENLARIRALAVQAQNGTYGEKSLIALNSEAQALMNEISRLNETAQYNGIKLFNTGKAEITNAGKELELNEQGFLQEVIVRDTSTMTKLSSVDETQALAIGTYSISTPDELAKLARMTNTGFVSSGCEFVLANDIDLSVYSTDDGWIPIGNNSFAFSAVFDANGYQISNLYISRLNDNYQGLFGKIETCNIKNLVLTNCDVSGKDNIGLLAGFAGHTNITNCVVSGDIKGENYIGGMVGSGGYLTSDFIYLNVNISGEETVGGAVGFNNYSSISNTAIKGCVDAINKVGGAIGVSNGTNHTLNINCTAFILGKESVGGIMGIAANWIYELENCYFAGKIKGDSKVAAMIGYAEGCSDSSIKTCIVEGEILGAVSVGIFIGASSNSANFSLIDSFYYSQKTGFCLSGDTVIKTVENCVDITIPTEYYLQVGINSDSKSSSITLTTYVDFSALSSLLQTGIEDESVLKQIDTLVNQVSLKQTEIGTAQNRLASVLEEISIKYDNLVSSRSTIQDADIAEESSAYIRNQILQQAAATLLATANQIPSIALQLL